MESVSEARIAQALKMYDNQLKASKRYYDKNKEAVNLRRRTLYKERRDLVRQLQTETPPDALSV